MREAIQATDRAGKAVGEAITALAALPPGVSTDFQKFFDAYVEAKNKKIETLAEDPWEWLVLQEYLRLGHDILKICVLRAKSEEDYLKVSDNQAKTYIVGTAYKLSRWYNGPPLVTTPGSDFSNVCSLLYEIVGGKTNESIAGAINRFQRSRARREIEDEYSVARFGKEPVAVEILKDLSTYAALSRKAKGLGPRPEYLIQLMADNAHKRGRSHLEKGPELIQEEEPKEETEARLARIKRWTIEYGEKRRRMRGIELT